MDLKEALIQYKESTLSLIEFVEKEHYDYIENALNNRQKIIDGINLIQYTKEEFKEIALQLKIDELEKQLAKIMGEKRDELKERILQLKKSKSATNAYYSNLQKSNMFSKKV